MAVTYQSVGAESYGTTDTATTAAPSGVAAGDLLLCQLYTRGTTHYTPASPPTGWTLVASQLDSATNYGDIYVYWRIADGSGDDTPSITLSATPTSGWHTRMIRLTGHDSTTPIDATAGANRAGSSDTAEIPTATAARNGSLAICFGGKLASSTDLDQTWPSGWTEIYDDFRTTDYRSLLAAGYDDIDAGAMSGGQDTAGWDSSLSGTVAMLTVIVQPPAGGGGSVIPVFRHHFTEQGIG